MSPSIDITTSSLCFFARCLWGTVLQRPDPSTLMMASVIKIQQGQHNTTGY